MKVNSWHWSSYQSCTSVLINCRGKKTSKHDSVGAFTASCRTTNSFSCLEQEVMLSTHVSTTTLTMFWCVTIFFFLPCFFSLPNRALQFPPEGWLRMSLNNGSITHLVIRPNGRVALRTLGDTGFMPPDKITRTWGVKVLAAQELPLDSLHSYTRLQYH